MTVDGLDDVIESLACGAARGLWGSTSTSGKIEEEPGKFARERNLLAITLAVRNGEFSGYYYEEDAPEYPVVWAELPHMGVDVDKFAREERLQVSWHIDHRLQQLVEDVLEQRRPPRGWDGHSRARKNDRLIEFVERA